MFNKKEKGRKSGSKECIRVTGCIFFSDFPQFSAQKILTLLFLLLVLPPLASGLSHRDAVAQKLSEKISEALRDGGGLKSHSLTCIATLVFDPTDPPVTSSGPLCGGVVNGNQLQPQCNMQSAGMYVAPLHNDLLPLDRRVVCGRWLRILLANAPARIPRGRPWPLRAIRHARVFPTRVPPR